MSGFQELASRTAVVTGGASGIGKGIARRLVGEGMNVVIADVEPAALDAAAAEIGAVAVQADVSSLESVQALADETLRRFGAVHLVCNNAGVGSTAPIADMTAADWRWLLGVNLFGVIHGVNVFLPLLLANPEGGHIVNTASMSGLRPAPGLGGYGVSKFGVVALSEVLAEELAASGARVGVTVLCPGPVRTNIKSSSRNRPAGLGAAGLVDTDLETSEEGARMSWLDPDEVGALVVRSVRDGDLYALTHPDMAPAVEARHRRIEDAFRAAAAD